MRTNTISNRSILIVHGRDFKPAEQDLMDISVAALRAGVERDYPDCVDALDSLSKDMAYFGDLTNELLDSQGTRYDATLDLGDRRNALAGLRTITVRKRFGIRQYDRVPGKSALREFVADIAAPLLGAVGMTMPLIGCVSKDCVEYLKGKSSYADEVRERAPDLILASWCGKKFDPDAVRARPGWDEVPAIAAGRLVEIDSSIALQPGPAVLSDGLQAISDAIAQTAAEMSRAPTRAS